MLLKKGKAAHSEAVNGFYLEEAELLTIYTHHIKQYMLLE